LRTHAPFAGADQRGFVIRTLQQRMDVEPDRRTGAAHLLSDQLMHHDVAADHTRELETARSVELPDDLTLFA